jgi:hypothetical protein
MNAVVEEMVLGYQEGTSDKVYGLFVVTCEVGYATVAYYGKRLGNPKKHIKTDAGVSLETALAALGRFNREKRAEGYTDLDPRAATSLRYYAHTTDGLKFVPLAERQAIIRDHPQTAKVITPEDIARQERIEQEDRARAQAAADKERREMQRNIALITRNLHVAIPFVQPSMLMVSLERANGTLVLAGEALLSADMGSRIRGLAPLIGGTFSAKFLVVGDRIIALTDLGRRHPQSTFRPDVVFTPERKIAILRAAIESTTDDSVVFYLPIMTECVRLELNASVRDALRRFIDTLSAEATAA